MSALITLKAQNIYVTSGGDISESTGSISFSIGQTFYSTIANSNYIIEEGILHCYEIDSLASGLSANTENIHFNVFPNPTADYINIKYNGSKSYLYQLINLLGEHVSSGIINEGINRVNFNVLASTYILNIVSDKKIIKSYKIVKSY